MKQATRVESTTAQPRPSTFVSLLSGWVQQGMESFFATQRILMDVAMRQNANTFKAMRESLSDPEHSPASMLTEMAVEGTANFIEAQRILLDLAQRENEIVLSGVKERLGNSNVATAMADLVQRSVETFVEMQQEFLTIANRQAQTWLHDAKAGRPYDPTRALDLAKEGMENFVRAQKKFLDVIAEQTEKATEPKREHPTKVTRTEMTKLARESATALMDAQKKLLDVATQQMNYNMKMAGKTGEMVVPFRMPIAKMTGEGVKSFVDAEKALIDSMMKRGQTERPAPRPIRKPAARRKARAHAARASA